MADDGDNCRDAALIVTLFNLDFYRFYLKRRRLWFTLRLYPCIGSTSFAVV